MKKRLFSIIALLLILVTGTCSAVSYTLPEKMYNQLSIGSGMKGSFCITAEGDAFRTPFLDAVTDAEWSLRGIQSGNDLHYYVFQSDDQENQTGLSEVYRKDGIYYFRSDMVQGQILAFPVLSQYLDTFFPSDGENGSSSSFVSGIIALPEQVKKDSWDPVLQRYQNELEMWLADFTVKADTVKMENGLSALDFSYEIPIDSINAEIVRLFGEFSSDPEVTALLDTVMTEEEKKTYVNGDLLYFYLEALQSLQIDRPVRMSKRVSAIGDLIRFSLELPLDERTTGFHTAVIETVNQLTVITLNRTGELIQFAFPDIEKIRQSAFEQSFWFARINNDPDKLKENLSLRVDIKKTADSYEKDEKSHEISHYVIRAVQDTSLLPPEADLSLLPEREDTEISADLHYSSKYAQNSATTLEINADIRQGQSAMTVQGKFKTAAPWLFMPFEIIDPIQAGTRKETVLEPYFTDWISNAASMVHHTDPSGTEETETGEADTQNPSGETAAAEEAPDAGKQENDPETAPLDVPDQE